MHATGCAGSSAKRRAIEHCVSCKDLKCFGAALSACDHGRQWQAGLALLATMEREGVAPGQIAYNCAAAWLKSVWLISGDF